MSKSDLSDTIVAIATAVGESGIGIVRISGKDSLKIIRSIFLCKSNKNDEELKSHTVYYGWIKDNIKENNETASEAIDEVLVTVMRKPRSFTREDVVEINCHGGILATREVLDLVLRNGARLAEPGEFTKRAFLNGRIDLAQAEAVLDVIRAKTDAGLRMSLKQLRGGFSEKIHGVSSSLLDVIVTIEASIDFPDEEITGSGLTKIKDKTTKINVILRELLDSAWQGKIMREGIHIVICGKPNVGKSSLLNALLKQERSIVTPVAGTTRDTIEEVIDIKGIPVRIVDTAGILEPRDLVEKKAVARSKEQINLADLAVIVFDGSKRLNKDDLLLVRRIKNKNTIAVINKIDLKQNIDNDRIRKLFKNVIGISAKKSKNINLLEDIISDLVYNGRVVGAGCVMVNNLRHINAIRNAQKLVADALSSIDNKLSLEYVVQDLREALGYLDRILGKSFSEDVLNKIFSDFCVGK